MANKIIGSFGKYGPNIHVVDARLPPTLGGGKSRHVVLVNPQAGGGRGSKQTLYRHVPPHWSISDIVDYLKKNHKAKVDGVKFVAEADTTCSGGPAPAAKPVPKMKKANKVKMGEEFVNEKSKGDEYEYDYEGDMAMSQLKSIMMNAKQLHDMLEPNTNLPEWVQSKITLAKDYIETARDYLQTQMNEEFVAEAFKLPPEYIKRGFTAARRAHGGGMTKAAWESFDDETKSKIKRHAIAIAFSLHKKAKAEARKKKKVEKVKKESIEEGRALTFQQRLVRSRQMRRIEPKVYRGQIRYQDRVPSQSRLEKRAERMARNLIKMRISHTPYDQMSIPEKIMIDKILEKKQKAIKKLAQRLLPKIRKISMQRISGSQIPMQTVQYQSTDYDDTLSMIESKLSNVEDNNLKESLQTIIALSTNEETAAVKSLRKKADVAKVSFEEIVSVYAEAVSEYTPQKITSEQYAFNAVNSFVSNKVNQLAEGLFGSMLGSMLIPPTTRLVVRALNSRPTHIGGSSSTGGSSYYERPEDRNERYKRQNATHSYAAEIHKQAGNRSRYKADAIKGKSVDSLSQAKVVSSVHKDMMNDPKFPKKEYAVNKETAIKSYLNSTNQSSHVDSVLSFDKHYHSAVSESVLENMFMPPQWADPINNAVEMVKATGIKNAIPVATKVAVDSAKTTMATLRSRAKEKK